MDLNTFALMCENRNYSDAELIAFLMQERRKAPLTDEDESAICATLGKYGYRKMLEKKFKQNLSHYHKEP